ncbi:MAG: alternative ribosome rescue aminoacyl-tRNA hydrolase ArfB [Bdellovibrionota bacterium]
MTEPSGKLPLDEISFQATRSSGPGGQNVNKVNTRMTLRWNAAISTALPSDVHRRFLAKFRARMTAQGELIISSDQHRSQSRNKQECLDRLSEMLESVWAAPKRRRKTKPSKAKREARLNAKKKRSAVKTGRKRGSWGE